MAQYRLHAKVISRGNPGKSGKGGNSVAAAAYRSGQQLEDERTGQTFDYTRKQQVEFTEILAPDNAPAFMRDRSSLWNAVEAATKRKDGQVAREFELMLPRELDQRHQIAAVRAWAKANLVREGMVVDIAIHSPRASDGQAQPHAHVMATMRDIDLSKAHGFGKKNKDWDDQSNMERWREKWAQTCNRALERMGSDQRVDHRSLERQRIDALERGDEMLAASLDRFPQPRLGPEAAAKRARGEPSTRVDRLLNTIKLNAARVAKAFERALGVDMADDQATPTENAEAILARLNSITLDDPTAGAPAGEPVDPTLPHWVQKTGAPTQEFRAKRLAASVGAKAASKLTGVPLPGAEKEDDESEDDFSDVAAIAGAAGQRVAEVIRGDDERPSWAQPSTAGYELLEHQEGAGPSAPAVVRHAKDPAAAAALADADAPSWAKPTQALRDLANNDGSSLKTSTPSADKSSPAPTPPPNLPGPSSG